MIKETLEDSDDRYDTVVEENLSPSSPLKLNRFPAAGKKMSRWIRRQKAFEHSNNRNLFRFRPVKIATAYGVFRREGERWWKGGERNGTKLEKVVVCFFCVPLLLISLCLFFIVFVFKKILLFNLPGQSLLFFKGKKKR